MKQISVISGKGGAGKTTIAASLLSFHNRYVMVDCDVDASNLFLLLEPRTYERNEFFGLDVAKLDPQRCMKCGRCREVCRFKAVNEGLEIDEGKCEGCAVCTLVCPVDAIEMAPRPSGESYVSETRFGPLVHAYLFPGAEASGKLVSDIRMRSIELARKENRDVILIDGPPGSGCEVIASITGVDLVLLVVEPTLSGVHDAKRALELSGHFKVEVVACINKFDINPDLAREIEAYLEENGVDILGRLPYDDDITACMVNGRTLTESGPEELVKVIRGVWTEISRRLNLN